MSAGSTFRDPPCFRILGVLIILISFTNTSTRASHSQFFEFLIYIYIYIYFFFKCSVFLFVLCFFTERERKLKNYECDGLGDPIPYKMIVSATLVKNCLRRCIFSSQSAIFQGEGDKQE